MDPAELLPLLLGTAALLPLLSFFILLAFGPRMGRAGVGAAYLATGAIGVAALLSFVALFGSWLPHHWPVAREVAMDDDADHASHEDGHDLVSGKALAENEHTEESPAEHAHADDEHDEHAEGPAYYTGEFRLLGTGQPWLLGQFGKLRLSVSYYIDALTVCMFCMVSLIATLIHVYSMGYMHEELHEVTDPEVTTRDGEPLRRRGRYACFFQYLSLFSFSMLGLVLAGNVALVFVFWELVGICSYFLIGFYIERKTASTAANKAFIVNRIGDFGMIVGLMALWASLGTFSFGELEYVDRDGKLCQDPGIFQLVGAGRQVQAPDGMVVQSAGDEVAAVVRESIRESAGEQGLAQAAETVAASVPAWRERSRTAGGHGAYWLFVVAGIGIFAGCVGKSAQFPLQVWLPDAMEGPTPVSALVHSATMVAAGVYLVGRFYPAFAPEVLLVIAIVGVITLFMAATIALTATDIKRVLAYSTISQLGYMMMALGVGAWVAGMMHLITHAFFKSLLFMCSGSVIHAVHSNEMTEMGGLLRKMPITALTMLVGCLAIAGAGLPFLIGLLGVQGLELSGLGLSGFYSKDAILEQAYSFLLVNRSAWAATFFVAAAAGAALTSFYMFRLWYLTFLGRPRNAHRYEHAHESPALMYVPLVILAVMAVAVAWQPVQGVVGALAVGVGAGVWQLWRGRREPGSEPAARWWSPSRLPLVLSGVVLAVSLLWLVTPLHSVYLKSLLEQAEPLRVASGIDGVLVVWEWPSEHLSHAASIVVPVTLVAIGTSLAGFVLATLMYATGQMNPREVRRQFPRTYQFLRNKWWFDELYDILFVRPTLLLARLAARTDRKWIDGFVDGLARGTRAFSTAWEAFADQRVVDGLVNHIASWTYGVGRSLRAVQTGQLRQYVMFLVLAAVALFVLVSFWNSTLAG